MPFYSELSHNSSQHYAALWPWPLTFRLWSVSYSCHGPPPHQFWAFKRASRTGQAEDSVQSVMRSPERTHNNWRRYLTSTKTAKKVSRDKAERDIYWAKRQKSSVWTIAPVDVVANVVVWQPMQFLHCDPIKMPPFYYCNNVVNYQSVFVVFGGHTLREICNKNICSWPMNTVCVSAPSCKMLITISFMFTALQCFKKVALLIWQYLYKFLSKFHNFWKNRAWRLLVICK